MPEGVPHQERIPETPTQTFERYCQELELTPEKFENKKILDVGAGPARFAQGLREAGITAEVVSIDRNIPNEGSIADPSLITMDAAEKILFPDNTFDYVISVSALPQVAAGHVKSGRPTGEIRNGLPVYEESNEEREQWKKTKKDLTARAISECLRVVKPSGEVRFGGIPEDQKIQPFVLDGFLNAIEDHGKIIQQGSTKKPYILKKAD